MTRASLTTDHFLLFTNHKPLITAYSQLRRRRPNHKPPFTSI